EARQTSQPFATRPANGDPSGTNETVSFENRYLISHLEPPSFLSFFAVNCQSGSDFRNDGPGSARRFCSETPRQQHGLPAPATGCRLRILEIAGERGSRGGS